MINFSNTHPVRDESSVEKNDAAYTPHSVRNADKLHDVAYLMTCLLWSGGRFSTELSSLTGCDGLSLPKCQNCYMFFIFHS